MPTTTSLLITNNDPNYNLRIRLPNDMHSDDCDDPGIGVGESMSLEMGLDQLVIERIPV